LQRVGVAVCTANTQCESQACATLGGVLVARARRWYRNDRRVQLHPREPGLPAAPVTQGGNTYSCPSGSTCPNGGCSASTNCYCYNDSQCKGSGGSSYKCANITTGTNANSTACAGTGGSCTGGTQPVGVHDRRLQLRTGVAVHPGAHDGELHELRLYTQQLHGHEQHVHERHPVDRDVDHGRLHLRQQYGHVDLRRRDGARHRSRTSRRPADRNVDVLVFYSLTISAAGSLTLTGTNPVIPRPSTAPPASPGPLPRPEAQGANNGTAGAPGAGGNGTYCGTLATPRRVPEAEVEVDTLPEAQGAILSRTIRPPPPGNRKSPSTPPRRGFRCWAVCAGAAGNKDLGLNTSGGGGGGGGVELAVAGTLTLSGAGTNRGRRRGRV